MVVTTVLVNHNSSYVADFTATCFGSCRNSHHQAEKVPKKSYVKTLYYYYYYYYYFIFCLIFMLISIFKQLFVRTLQPDEGSYP
jgi:hypothetical protein